MKKSNSNVLKLDSKTKHIIIKILKPFANNFILLNPKKHVKKNKVNLDYWGDKPNLGDAISPIIVNYMLNLKGLTLDKPVVKTKHLYAVGSVITAGVQDCTVWGNGVLYTVLNYRIKNRELDIRSVRGPLTRLVLMEYGYNVPEIYGDPAILMPEIYYPVDIKKTCKYGIVMHKNGSSHLKDLDKLDGTYKMIDIKTNNYEDFINDLMSVDYIISTSLHGIILAESYGIPAILVQPEFSLFKYYDYYCSTGRANFPIIQSIEELQFVDFPEIPNFDDMRAKIKEVFPYDIFMN
ncbi:MAG: polysaccharide pyruvyl transferase family protein [Erysipelotrichaceae bacterium]|nr:polysaccharide pyruvyl transferase family protein [Erysipelotrichaceae bacterium]